MRITFSKVRIKKGVSAIAMGTTLGVSPLTIAQETSIQTYEPSSNAASVLLEEVVVTATKKANGESIQTATVSMNAFGEDQLDALQVRDIASLGFKMPNVALDDIGTFKGVANFTIRGLGINSSIPSIDPTVGVFVDGVYLGINSGVVFDTFDLESVEALRGPQGVLFGRNVTGGAVLINTGDPTDEFAASAKGTIEGGGEALNYYLQSVVSGPLIKDTLSGKLGVYHNDDGGWFKNLATGDAFGKSETTLIRSALRFTPVDTLEVIAKYEHGSTEGDGPAGQSHRNGSGVDGQVVNYDRDSFDFAIDEEGISDAEWDQVSIETNIDVDFGEGVITNIFGWRQFEQYAQLDVDATPLSIFHPINVIDHEQVSNELRYNGRFFDDQLDFSTGFFYFQQDLNYGEQRDLLAVLTGGVTPAATQDGGGILDQETIGIFAAGTYDLTDRLSITAGLRYTEETKDVQIASLTNNVNNPCIVVPGDSRSTRHCDFDFVDSFTTSNISPKVGFSYELDDNLRIYSHWTRAFRAGGFNFRNSAADTVNFGPGPFEDEQVDSFEIGFKSEPSFGGTINGAVFYTDVSDMQREVNLGDSSSGVVQVIRNTADAEIYGLEINANIPLSDSLILMAGLGLLEGKYTDVVYDLNRDSVIDNVDKNLDIPRLSPVSGSLGLTYYMPLGSMLDTSINLNYSYREDAAYTDDNLGRLNAQNRFDASIAFDIIDSGAIVTLYGKNLTNEVYFGNDTQLPAAIGPVAVGGTFAPLSRGRQIGLELKYTY